jgi:probable HAF family extracellular repeat protein
MSTRKSAASRIHRTAVAALAAGVTLIMTASASAGAGPVPDPLIQLTVLGTLGGASSMALQMNENGQVVGWAETKDGSRHAFLWQHGRMTDLGTLGGPESLATGINDRGQVTGWATTADGATRAFQWQRGVMTDLGTPPPATTAIYGAVWHINTEGQIAGDYVHSGDDVRSYLWDRGRLTDIGNLGQPVARVTDLNDKGDIIGFGSAANGGTQSYLWRDGVMTNLGAPLPGQSFFASDLNDRGQVTGRAQTRGSDGVVHAVVWQHGHWTDLGALDGDTGGYAMNERGTVVGAGIVGSEYVEHAFIARGGTIRDLGAMDSADGASSAAIGVNDHDQVIGGGVTSGGDLFAFLWQDGTMHRLPGLGSTGDGVSDINNRGQIAGTVATAAGGSRAALWTVHRGGR